MEKIIIGGAKIPAGCAKKCGYQKKSSVRKLGLERGRQMGPKECNVGASSGATEANVTPLYFQFIQYISLSSKFK